MKSSVCFQYIQFGHVHGSLEPESLHSRQYNCIHGNKTSFSIVTGAVVSPLKATTVQTKPPTVHLYA